MGEETKEFQDWKKESVELLQGRRSFYQKQTGKYTTADARFNLSRITEILEVFSAAAAGNEKARRDVLRIYSGELHVFFLKPGAKA
jgi:hypothetical protein